MRPFVLASVVAYHLHFKKASKDLFCPAFSCWTHPRQKSRFVFALRNWAVGFGIIRADPDILNHTVNHFWNVT